MDRFRLPTRSGIRWSPCGISRWGRRCRSDTAGGEGTLRIKIVGRRTGEPGLAAMRLRSLRPGSPIGTAGGIRLELAIEVGKILRESVMSLQLVTGVV